MRIILKILVPALVVVATRSLPAAQSEQFPYAKAGLTTEQAAAHLLNRFAYGPRPGDIERLVAMGLENWFEAQLRGSLPDSTLEARLQIFSTPTMSAYEIASTFLNPGMLVRLAAEDGVISRRDTTIARPQQLAILERYRQENGYRSVREYIGEMMAQKLLRAVYSENQLREVLTDFWFNHFNVSITDNQCRPYVYAYERDAIRPHVFGDFRTLLGATARHPAILLYLDNAQSTAPDSMPTTMDYRVAELRNQPGFRGAINRFFVDRGMRRYQREREARMQEIPKEFRPHRGINENYARELMELHTLGVDGGYTQQDVIEVARAFTGWAIFPPGPRGERIEKRLRRSRAVGFLRDGDFIFRADAHDAGEKTILGVHLPAGRGIEDGEQVLDILSHHPSTARFISRKLAMRFVSDSPSDRLVSRLAEVFQSSSGNLRAVLRAIAYAPEFWAKENRGAKIKSPFELVVSAFRALNADLRHPRQAIEWIERMGQTPYAYAAPTGYPENSTTWVNTGALLNRMSFGLNLAFGRIRGVHFDLLALNQNQEPESPEAALRAYAALLMPQCDLSGELEQIRPLLDDPDIARKLEQHMTRRAGAHQAAQMNRRPGAPFEREMRMRHDPGGPMPEWAKPGDFNAPQPPGLARVVGILFGSPEFQRK